MTFVPADRPSLVLFVAFAAGMLGVVVLALRRARATPTYYLALGGYLAGFVAVVAVAPLASRPLPGVPLLFASVLAAAIALAASPVGGRLAAGTALTVLIGLQAFRLPLELLLHHWAARGTVPPTMTWTGANLDIVAGALALIAAPWVERHRAIGWATTAIGLALLLNVLRVVVMSSPLPFAWPLERPLLLIAYLPYALIGPLFVGVALAGHLIALRRLWGHRAQ